MLTLTAEDIRKPEAGFAYHSGKNYTHAVGLSCAFRQWRADSHCQYIHGYALQVDLEFGSPQLDERSWVQDFGGLKLMKELIVSTFDHKLCVAQDDPKITIFREMQIAGLAELSVLPAVGCEAFARIIYDMCNELTDLADLTKVTVREHDSNWASYGHDASAQLKHHLKDLPRIINLGVDIGGARLGGLG